MIGQHAEPNAGVAARDGRKREAVRAAAGDDGAAGRRRAPALPSRRHPSGVVRQGAGAVAAALGARLATTALFRFYPAASRAKALLGGHGTREVRRLIADAHAFAGAEALACRARATLSIDASDALASCPVPVLYL